MKRILKYFLIILVAIFLIVICFFFVGFPKETENITWGVNFSQKHAQALGLDWREAYSALLDDLGVRNFKIGTHWDLIEPEQNNYTFEDLDWQIQELEKKGARANLVIGMKTPRWPEGHIPEWAKGLSKEEQQDRILKLVEETVLKYKDSGSIWAWQVENEPFFVFGDCPWYDKEFFKKEVQLVKSLDSFNKTVIISDTGEWSLWTEPAKIGDIVAVTMYRKVWAKEIKMYLPAYFPATYYSRRAFLVEKIFNKKVICGELQVEPWCPSLLYDCSLAEQKKTMDLDQFKKNISFAKKTGLDEFYLWGSEWWYWLKEKENMPEIWQEAKKLF